MDRIGIRELRQNASRYVDRAEAGETIEVTNRGRVVAVLAPHAASDEDPVAARIRQGDWTAPTESFDSLPEFAVPGGPPLSRILEEQRKSERY